jgi:hypothetical protein
MNFHFSNSVLLLELFYSTKNGLPSLNLYLKVVGNEKVGGSGRWHMIDIGLGPW